MNRLGPSWSTNIRIYSSRCGTYTQERWRGLRVRHWADLHRATSDSNTPAAARTCEEQPSTSTFGADLVKKQLALSHYQINPIYPSAVDTAWKVIQELVKQLSEYVTRSLPGFWRIAKACMDGKYRRRDPTGDLTATRRPASTCRAMALEIIKLYISTLSQFFTLSDVAIAEAAIREDGEDPPIPPFVPAGTTVIAACYFSERLLEDLAECAGELMVVDVGSEAGQGLRSTLDSLRWRFEEVIAATWARGKLLAHDPQLNFQIPDYYTSSKTGKVPQRGRLAT